MDAAVSIAGRWALVADMMLVFGVPLFTIYTADPGKVPLRAVVTATAIMGLLLSGAGMAVLAASMTGVPLAEVDGATIALLVTGTAAGTAFLVRAIALSIALTIALGDDGRAARSGLALCGAVALASLAWTGHGVMDDGRTGIVHLVADILHLLAAGAWVGALAALAWLLIGSRTAPTLAWRALGGFASAGTVAVGLVLASGAVNTWLLVGPANLPSLGNSTYGRLLLIKLALFAVMVVLAALNRFRLTPALGAAAANGDTRRAARALRLSIALELSLAIAILGLVAWLGTLAPPISTG